jgi:hypothetical protein
LQLLTVHRWPWGRKGRQQGLVKMAGKIGSELIDASQFMGDTLMLLNQAQVWLKEKRRVMMGHE